MATPADHSPLPGITPPFLVGREREEMMLRECLRAALDGHGGLILIGGEAGIGKTALAEALCQEAHEAGTLVLVGRCYDLSETPPYGPWLELFEQYPPSDDCPPLPVAFAGRGTIGNVESQAALFQQVQGFLSAVSASRPLVLLLDDLHWADPASLDLLRYIARTIVGLPILLIVTYRADELTRLHPLHHLLPLLEREARAARLNLRPLTADAVRALIETHYQLPEADTARLVTYVQQRAEGNAFFTTELLRALEEDDLLCLVGDGWMLRDLLRVQVPTPLRQVIDGRLARLGEETQGLLAMAAIIGQDIPLDVWADVSGADEEMLSAVVEQAVAAHLMDETPDGTSAHFVHALIRETLYEGILPSRRRRMHRQVGEALAGVVNADPDAVAYHFGQAGDARATEWLIKAGERAERSFAWRTAADRYEAVTILIQGSKADAGQRGWLFLRIGWLRRFANLHAGIVAVEEASRRAAEAEDRTLAAYAMHVLGTLHCRIYEFRRGLAELEQSLLALDALSVEERMRLRSRVAMDVSLGTPSPWDSFVLWLAFAGRYTEARTIGERVLAEMANVPHSNRGEAAPHLGTINFGLGLAYSAQGQPTEARAAFGRSRLDLPTTNPIGDANSMISDLEWVVLPYQTDLLAVRATLATQIEEAFALASGALADTHPRGLAFLSLWVLEGRWTEARQLAVHGYAIEGNANSRLIATRALGALLYYQGESDHAWALVREWLPEGPATQPGGTYFLDSLLMQQFAARLAIDAGDLPKALLWLEAHDRWLAWGGNKLGQAEGQLGWAMYHRAAGNSALAYEHANQALADASEPRQPLALLAAHRLLGELDTAARRSNDAATHLDQSLALADACAAPYERALTLLAQATLRAAMGNRTEAMALLDQVRAICTPLGAKPVLARLDTLAVSFSAAALPLSTYPDGLTEREIEVLRLIAAGMSNREIADTLSVSVRTIERHIENLYRKIEAHSKADATAYAFRHHLI